MNYFLFCLTLFSYLGLAILNASQPSLSGDGAMGYGLGLAFFGFAFTVSSLALTISMLWKENFVWISADSGVRTGVTLFCWFLVALTTFFCAAFKWEWHSEETLYPPFLHWLAVSHGQIWIPLLWLVACFLSLNKYTQFINQPQATKVLFYAGMAISAIYSFGLAVGYVRESARGQAEEMATRNQQQDQWHQETMKSIAAHNAADPITGLLVYSMQSQPADIRAAALAKIKSHPDWEIELLALLKDRNTYAEVYYFLDGNTVSKPKDLAGPLNESILLLAERIKRDIADSNNLQNWSFDMYRIENLFRAIDGQFLNQGVDFVPNVVELDKALKTPPPARFKGVHFNIADVVEAWLEKQKAETRKK